MGKHIFISYSHDDAVFASKLANDLLDQGYEVWLDTIRLSGGANWEHDIMQAIDECEYFLLVWSANVEGSSYTQKEKEQAVQAHKTIIPILCSGEAARMWDDLKSLQWLDFQDNFAEGMKKLLAQIPLPIGKQPPPDLKALIKQGDTKFHAAARLWRSHLAYQIDSKTSAVGLLIERSVHGVYSYVFGDGSDNLRYHDTVQIFFNFSGLIDKDRFEDYLNYRYANGQPLWTILIRGPIASTSRGLEYRLPDESRSPIWQAAVQLAWRAIGQVSLEHMPIELYINAPVALAAGFCAAEHFRRELKIYQIDLSAKTINHRYFLAYQY